MRVGEVFASLLPAARALRRCGFRIPWKIVGIMALAGLASGISGLFANIDEGMGAIHRIWATAVAGGALMYAAFHGEKSFDLRKLAQACLIAAIAAYAFTRLRLQGLGRWFRSLRN